MIKWIGKAYHWFWSWLMGRDEPYTLEWRQAIHNHPLSSFFLVIIVIDVILAIVWHLAGWF